MSSGVGAPPERRRVLVEFNDTAALYAPANGVHELFEAWADRTPEAIKPLLRREMDGFSILFHQASFGTVGFSTLQSRAFAGQVDETFVFCLPGSTGACRDGWDRVLKHELDSRYRPCSLAGQVPRLRDLCA